MYGTDMEAGAPAEIRDMFARAQASGGTAAPAESDDSPVEELARLSELWKSGALSDTEFADAKARLLPRIGT
jgi:membrane protease subunit (stomatin/prohibitin family)